MRGGALDSPPLAKRSSIGIGADGSLHVDRIAYSGYWKGSGQRRAVLLNQPATTQGVTTLYTSAYGPTTPVEKVSVLEETLSPFPASAPNTDLVGTVTSTSPAGGVPIPPGGAVLVARGGADDVSRRGGARRQPGHGAPDPDAELGRDHRRDRRRAGARPQRQGGLPRERALRDEHARHPLSPHRGRPARRRPHRPRRGGREPARLQHRDDELRAGARAPAPRRRPGLGARRRILDGDGVRRRPPQPALRPGRRALGLRRADAALHGRLRAAARRTRALAERTTGSPTSSRWPTRSCARRP